eukprot:XP_011607500.1 PREDICTED: poly [ADP-ribose] polymerase 10 isoform X1 [Takifugu rubripes]
MPDENKERTLEVVNLPPEVDQELLALYFANKRRSGGGPLVSVEKMGDRAVVVFEETEDADRVLSKESHTLQNTELRVRKPARKDRRRLLLRGLGPSTSLDCIEMYVENILGLNLEDYQLHFTPARDAVIIQLSQPLSEDFQTLSAKISKHSLDEALMTLEEIQQTDSVLVGNLHPGTSPDMLSLYFESRGGNHMVMGVTMLSEGTAKVSFVDYDSVDHVLAQPHKLKGAELEVRPFFDFLQPPQLSDTQAGPQTIEEDDSQPSQMAPELLVEMVPEAEEDQTEEKASLTDLISISDPVKLELFQLGTFQRDMKNTHPDVMMQVRGNGVLMEAADRPTFEQVKNCLLEYFCSMAETHFTLEPEEAEFLERKEVKERLQRNISQTPATYLVLDNNVVVTALSRTSAHRASSFLKSQLAHVSIMMDSQYKCIFFSSEWSKFLQELSLCSVKVSAESIDILTLKGMESEMHTLVQEFLNSQIETEAVVCMEPGVLKYIQTHCHDLLVYMDQVSVVPLELVDVWGLKIYGHAVACNAAQEMLEGIVSSVCTRTITVSAPGITRYLFEEECKMFLSDMEEEFQVCMPIKQQPWEPLAEQDIFKAAWVLIATKNFPKVSVDALNSDAMQNNQGEVSDLLENAKMVISNIDDGLLECDASADQRVNLDHLDLYTESQEEEEDEDESPDATGAGMLYGSRLVSLGDDGHSSEDLEEEAGLSLAVQYSIDSSQRSLMEEKQLQKALVLSKEMSQRESPVDQLNEAIRASLEEASNSVHLHVFGTDNSNLMQMEVAFKERVSQGQVVEQLDHRAAGEMTEYDRKCLEAIERKHGVAIQIDGTKINISGFRKFVSQALCDMTLVVNRMSQSPSDQEILKDVQWMFHDPLFTTASPYSPDVIVFLENAWRMKMGNIDILLDRQRHVINFRDMQEYNTASGESKTISRETIGSEVVDRKGPGKKCALLTNLPNATKVDEASDEYRNVTQAFFKAMRMHHNKIRIVQVDKLLNQLLFHQYQLKRMSVQQGASNPEYERTLYHGTSEDSVKEICLHGFTGASVERTLLCMDRGSISPPTPRSRSTNGIHPQTQTDTSLSSCQGF